MPKQGTRLDSMTAHLVVACLDNGQCSDNHTRSDLSLYIFHCRKPAFACSLYHRSQSTEKYKAKKIYVSLKVSIWQSRKLACEVSWIKCELLLLPAWVLSRGFGLNSISIFLCWSWRLAPQLAGSLTCLSSGEGKLPRSVQFWVRTDLLRCHLGSKKLGNQLGIMDILGTFP